MILNSWNTFHETEKLLESSPSCPASKSPRGLNSLSESELNETQEYPLLKNSAAESQDFTRSVYSNMAIWSPFFKGIIRM